jgi:hypothetical protein
MVRTWVLSSSSWSTNSIAVTALPAVVPGEAESRLVRSRSTNSSGLVLAEYPCRAQTAAIDGRPPTRRPLR